MVEVIPGVPGSASVGAGAVAWMILTGVGETLTLQAASSMVIRKYARWITHFDAQAAGRMSDKIGPRFAAVMLWISFNLKRFGFWQACNEAGLQDLDAWFAINKTSLPGFPQPLAVIHDQPAARKYFLREPNQLPTFEQVVIGAMLGVGDAVSQALLRIPDDDICIRAWQQGALLGV